MAKRAKQPEFQSLMGEVLVTPPCRAQFVHLVKPDTGNNQYSDDKYKLHMLFPKEKVNSLNFVMQACLRLCQESWPDLKSLDYLDRIPFKDGDENSAANWQGFPGTLYLCSRSKDPVQCVGPDRQLITPDQIYSGCWVRCGLAPYTYQPSGDGSSAVTLLLQFVQFLKDDSRFKGGDIPAIEDVFGAFDGDLDALLDGEDSEEEAEVKEEKKSVPVAAKKAAPKKKGTGSSSNLLGMLK